MRINVVIDDELLSEAQKVSGLKTKKHTVEEALRMLIAVKKQSAIRSYRGRLHGEGDLDRMRMDK